MASRDGHNVARGTVIHYKPDDCQMPVQLLLQLVKGITCSMTRAFHTKWRGYCELYDRGIVSNV